MIINKRFLRQFVPVTACVCLSLLPICAMVNETHTLFYVTSNTRVYYTMQFGDGERVLRGYAKVYGRDRVNTATTWTYYKWTKFTAHLGNFLPMTAKAEDLGPTDNTKYTDTVYDVHPSDYSLSCYYDYKKYTYSNSVVPDHIENSQ